ncbi:MAG: hypothetical protein ACOYK6_05180 [Chthoniobacterales bacterium]
MKGNFFEETLKKLTEEQQKWAHPILDTFAKDILQEMRKHRGDSFSTEDYLNQMQVFNEELSILFENPSKVTTNVLENKCKESKSFTVTGLYLQKLTQEQQQWVCTILRTFAKDILQEMRKHRGDSFSTEDYLNQIQVFNKELIKLFDNPSDVTFTTLSQTCKEFRESLVAGLKARQSSVSSHS